MKKYLDHLADLMVTRRWFALAWNAGLLAMIGASGWLNIRDGNTVALVIDAVVIGMIISSTMHLIFARGLYKGLDEYERAMMRADCERQMHLAWEDFVKRHPEADLHVSPIPRFKQ